MKNRQFYLDNLRTFLIFLVVVLHCGLVYESVLEKSWIVVDTTKADWIGLIRMYLDVFVMFGLFFISGYFVSDSYNRYDTWTFIKKKASRILLPWLVAVLTMIPLYKMIFLYSRGLPQESWYTYFHIFSRPAGDPYFYADNPVMNWLWFLPILFAFQVIYLILRKLGTDFAGIGLKSALWILLGAGLAYSMTASGLGFKGWYHSAIFHFQQERLLVYLLVFLMGTVVYEKNFLDRIVHYKKWYIYANIILTVALLIFTVTALNLFFNLIDPGREFYFITPGADRTFYYLSMLTSMMSMIYILLYSFKLYVNQSGTVARILSGNSYNVYIIHIVVLGLIALPLLKVSIPASAKFFILTLTTYFVSNALVWIYNKHIHRLLNNTIVKCLVILAAGYVTFTVYTLKEDLKTQVNNSVPDSSEMVSRIHEATATGNIAILKEHLQSGQSLDIREPSGGSTPIITASLFGQKEVVEFLIQNGADLNIKNNDGSTALHTAALIGNVEIVQLLITGGIDKTIVNNTGSTAYQTAAAPYEMLKPIIDYLDTTFSLELDTDQVIRGRREIAQLLKE